MKELPLTEYKVMEAAWQLEEPFSSSEIVERLTDSWKVQTVNTLLLRLEKKGFIRTFKDGRDRKYTTLISCDEYKRYASEEFLKLYHGGFISSFVSTLVAGNSLTKEDVEELRKMIDKTE